VTLTKAIWKGEERVSESKREMGKEEMSSDEQCRKRKEGPDELIKTRREARSILFIL